MLEIRWHGRGGQGTKTAALLLAETVIEEGKYGQGFPDYGPERMGAPMRGFNRISDQPIRIHSGITEPDVVVVLDQTLLDVVNVIDGLKEDGLVIINTEKSPGEIRQIIKARDTQKVAVVNASQIALDTIGRDIPNTVMIGALIKLTNLIDIEHFIANLKKKFAKRFVSQIIEGNINAINRAYNEVIVE